MGAGCASPTFRVWEAGSLTERRRLWVWRHGGGEGGASVPWALRAQGRGSRSWPWQRLPVRGGEWCLLCTQLRTWLDGPTPLSPGMWQGACCMMSPAALPPPALCSEEVWHIASASEHFWWGWGRGQCEGSAHVRDRPVRHGQSKTDPGGQFSDFSTEVIPRVKERICITPRPGSGEGGSGI